MAGDTDSARENPREVIEAFTEAVHSLTVIAQRLGSLQPTPQSPPTREQVDGLDTAFRYRLLRSLMTAARVEDIAATLERDRGGLRVKSAPKGVTSTHLSLVGGRLDSDGQVAAELPLSDGRVLAAVLRDQGIDVNRELVDLRLLGGADGPVVAIAPPLPGVQPGPVS